VEGNPYQLQEYPSNIPPWKFLQWRGVNSEVA